MLTFVGAMSGYCSTGSEKNAPIPPSITMIARTQAKIGRSMNIRDMAELSAPACAAASGRGCRRDVAAHRLVLGVDDGVDGGAVDVALQCRLRDEEGARVERLVEHRLRGHAGEQQALRVGGRCTQRDRAGALVDGDV